MKVLIVDDNVAIQEISRDILAGEGHIVRVASTVGEAVSKIASFSPDVVILDSKVDGEDGMHVISRAREELISVPLRVILLKNASELAPSDDPSIRSSIDKPFKSTEILEALKSLESEVQSERADNDSRRKKEKKEKKWFGRRSGKREAPPEDALERGGISFGTSYVVFEPSADSVYDLIGLFDPGRYNIMIVTDNKVKAIKERFSYGSMEIVPLSLNRRSGSVGIQELGSLMSRIEEFVSSNARPVVFFDTFGDIIASNGMNQSLLMLNQLMSGFDKPFTFGVSVDGAVLTEKDKGIFLHNMTEYVSKE